MTQLRRRFASDDGVSAVLVALFVVFVVIPVAAVSVDLTNAYSNRRQMQNAADAAAQAGAQQLQAVRLGTATASTLATTVGSVASANGADTTDPHYSCTVVHVSYGTTGASIDPSPQTPCAGWGGDTTTYNAVTVTTEQTVPTFFARAIVDTAGGATSTSAAATATATVQKVTNPLLGDAVFAMCAYADAGNGKNGTTDPTWVPILTGSSGSFALNPAAIGHRYVVWSNAGGSSNLSRCGLASSSFDGLICGMAPGCTQPITFPADGTGSWLAISTGAQVGPTLATMAGYPACDPSTLTGSNKPSFAPCAMVIPVCDSSNTQSGTNGELHCDAFGEFLLSPGQQDTSDSSCTFITGSSATICGQFLGAPLLADGAPTAGDPGANDPTRIALVQ